MQSSLSVNTQGEPTGAAYAPGVAKKTTARWSRLVAVDVVGLLDALAITLGALLPAAIYAMAGGMTMRWPVVLQTGLLTALIATWCLNNWRLYDPDKVHDFPVAVGRLLAALGIAFVAVLGVGMPFHANEPHLWVWYTVWASFSFMLLLANRLMARLVLAKAAAAGAFDIRIAVYGAGPVARRVRDHLIDPASRIAFAGMFDDRPSDRVNSEGLTFAGRLDDLIALAHDGRVDRIIVALPAAAECRISMIAKRLEAAPASVHIVTHVASDLVDVSARHEVSSLGPVGLLDVKGRTLGDWSPVIKRAEDVAVGSLLLIVLAPVMAVIAALVWLESTGPVLVTERRRGINQSTLTLARFRTTRRDELSPLAGSKTRVGIVLERFGLDELPQLVSVLKGEMSIVGPRPFPLLAASVDAADVERTAIRHQVKPGMTGLSQLDVSVGGAVATELDRDLAYIARWNPALDVRIIWCTMCAALAGRQRA